MTAMTNATVGVYGPDDHRMCGQFVHYLDLDAAVFRAPGY